MKLLPAAVLSIFVSLKFRRRDTSGVTSEPYVAVAMKHSLGGAVWDVDDWSDDEDEEDDVLDVDSCRTMNCVCWAAVKFPLCAVTKIVYWPGENAEERGNWFV
jgi:hypothetical protein